MATLCMATLCADDGTLLAYDEIGAGAPLICRAGGPMHAAAYFGDLGGLGAHRRLERFSHRVGWLVLVCPSPRAIDLEVPDEARRAIAQLRRDEPWYPEAIAAFERIWAGCGAPAVRAALRELRTPVLLLVGEYDMAPPPDSAAALAAAFPGATLATQPGAGHSPWFDDPAWSVATAADFLG